MGEKEPLIQMIKLSEYFKNKQFVPVTSLAVNQDATIIAIGFGNGKILLIRRRMDLKFKIKLLNGIDDQRITGLYFKPIKYGVLLFCVTFNYVFKYEFHQKIEGPKLLGEKGSEQGCSYLSDGNELVIANREGIWIHNDDQIGNCYLFHGKKILMTHYKDYPVIVSSDTNKLQNIEQTITIYDLKNKFIPYKFSSEEMMVMNIFVEWDTIIIIAKFRQDNDYVTKMLQLTEKDLQQKLKILFTNNLYSQAIKIIDSSKMDVLTVADVYRRFGDYLYAERDYDGAMLQYIQTIGIIEPTYVMKKFLNAKQIDNLILYLEKLHEKGKANMDHTIVLLTCYTKVENGKKKLNNFLREKINDKFDIKKVIDVCLKANFIDQAQYLAYRFKQYDVYISILIDRDQYLDALQFIESLPFDLASTFLKQYGRILLTNLPKQTTNVLIRLCTNYYALPLSQKDRTLSLHNDSKKKTFVPPQDFLHLFSELDYYLMLFLENVIYRRPPEEQYTLPPVIFNTLLELYLDFNELIDSELPWVDDYYYVIPELEIQKKSFEQRIAILVESPDSNLNMEQALILLMKRKCVIGIIKLYERLELYHELLHFYLEIKKYEEAIKIGIQLGKQNPVVLSELLKYFVRRKLWSEIEKLLDVIGDTVPPYEVVNILMSNKKLRLETAEKYLMNIFTKYRNNVLESKEIVEKNFENSDKMIGEYTNLIEKPTIFQNQKCSKCALPLDMPSIHFMCTHSFHARCCVNENECPICSSKFHKIGEKLRELEKDRESKNEEYLKSMSEIHTSGGIEMVAHFLGKGIISKCDEEYLKEHVFEDFEDEEDEEIEEEEVVEEQTDDKEEKSE